MATTPKQTETCPDELKRSVNGQKALRPAHRSMQISGALLAAILASSAILPPTSDWPTGALAPVVAQAKDKKAEAQAIAERLALPMAPVTATQPEGKIALPEGTRVKLVLLDELKSNKSQRGDQVHYALQDDLRGPNGEVLIPKGTSAVGTIKTAKGAGGLGRKGKLEFTVDSISTASQEKVALRSSQAVDGKGRGGTVVALSLFVTPLALFMKGKNTSVPRGEIIEAYVDAPALLPKGAFDNMTRHDVDALVQGAKPGK
jgi:hypothetical protein